MRLLELSPGGKCTLTRNLDHNKVPPYAILSHTWQHGQEVTYEDLIRGKRSLSPPYRQRSQRQASNAAGWRKVDFCLAQTRQDGLRHCWIDSCCINKAHPDEKHGAFNAMYSWYQNAHVCYVYLQDVLVVEDLVGSRWWTRGWTLQELLAPSRVVFFSGDGVQLGDKVSLQHVIHSITRISNEVLVGSQPLAEITIEEKLSWMKGRQTTFEEDWAYCLQGILGFEMSRRYGEGRLRAIERLKKEAARRATELRETELKRRQEERQQAQREEELRQEQEALRRRAELDELERKTYDEETHKQLLETPKRKGSKRESQVADSIPSRPKSHETVTMPGYSAPHYPGADHGSALPRPPRVIRSSYYSSSPASSVHDSLVIEDERIVHRRQRRDSYESDRMARPPPLMARPRPARPLAPSRDESFDPAQVEVTLEDLLAVGPKTSSLGRREA